MRLFLDHDVYAITARFLRGLGHDVIVTGELGYEQKSDIELLDFAQDNNRILITRDRDFGSLVFVSHAGSGVIYLRIHPSSLSAVHQELERILDIYSESEIREAFVVVEAGRHRFRKLT
jgi:predicted nuclease of predicted toxin-antitoxin system